MYEVKTKMVCWLFNVLEKKNDFHIGQFYQVRVVMLSSWNFDPSNSILFRSLLPFLCVRARARADVWVRVCALYLNLDILLITHVDWLSLRFMRSTTLPPPAHLVSFAHLFVHHMEKSVCASLFCWWSLNLMKMHEFPPVFRIRYFFFSHSFAANGRDTE